MQHMYAWLVHMLKKSHVIVKHFATAGTSDIRHNNHRRVLRYTLESTLADLAIFNKLHSTSTLFAA